MANNNKTQWEDKELGVGWKRKSKTSGESYFTGTLNFKKLGFDKDVAFICFSNKNKKNDNHPDIRFYISEPKTAGAVASKPKTVAPTPAPEVNDNELI